MQQDKHNEDTPGFAELDQAQRDAAYNNSLAVSDSPERLRDWEQRSSVCRSLPSSRLDIRYGAKPNNRFDYFTTGDRRAPLFIFIHGGYWQRNSKEVFGFVSTGPCARGVNVATIGYSLAPAANLSEIVSEVFRAIDCIASLADELGFDAQRIFVGGWSAGGHLAALAADRAVVKGVISISGIFDLEPIALTYLNKELQLQPFEVQTLAPIRNLARGNATMMLFVGGSELPELQRQSRAYQDCAQAAGLDVSMAVLPDLNHYTIMEELAAPEGAVTRSLLELVARTADA
ncbi:alpha/beta hydrolase [Hoeflea sp.]|uniref:alpha/beta hydrolase n=1 Tax=Hoeflea sp. TaxID=1940281 RepID=UPI0019CE92CF|nr:alpha/beta hydrolase [Hoeflea sp.]MBC7284428.1 alpha/beta hydrolase [Hoeflea sp.]